MSSRVVRVRTVRDYVNAALVQLDRAASAAMRCDDVRPMIQTEIVREYRALARISRQLTTRTTPKRTRHGHRNVD